MVARIGISTLLLPALLISSLLSFPSTCRCGAELPHTHSIFGLAGHSHGATGADATSVGDPGHPHADEPGHQHTDSATDVAPLPVELDGAAAATLADTTPQAGAVTADTNAFDSVGHAPGTTPNADDGPEASATVQVQVRAPGSAPVAPGIGLPVAVTTESVTAHASELRVAAEQTLAGRDTLPDTPPPQILNPA